MTSTLTPDDGLDPVLADLERFRAFIRSRLSDVQVVDDVLQEALLRATRGIASLRDSDRLDAWFYRIIRRAIADRGRGPAAVTTVTIDPATLETEPTEQTAICLVDVDGVDPEQAAKRLGIATSVLHARRYRARIGLRIALEALCQACAREGCSDCHCEPQPKP